MDFDFAALAFIDGLGAPEMVLIFVVVLVLFGGQKLPEFARGLGKSMREFKKAAAGVEEEFKRALEEDERKQAAALLPPPAPATTTPPTAAAHDYDHMHDDYHHDEYGNPLESTPKAETPADPAGPGTPVMQPAAITSETTVQSPEPVAEILSQDSIPSDEPPETKPPKTEPVSPASAQPEDPPSGVKSSSPAP